ncbi:hypothetical protein B9Z55_013164 [Caenorhabditis nigoni]|uniref:Uncharacterized protein n=1 Tax=Caenorhabditis nigoni TaxID=1611254 RepID=A0A2G5U0I4_9PELO|nr:hypothetical protein B9Z55_013164 [Caenorhabditis nigoni]
MKILLLSVLGVLMLVNVLASDSEVKVVRMDMTDALKTSGLVDLEVSDDAKGLKDLTAKMIFSSLIDELDAKFSTKEQQVEWNRVNRTKIREAIGEHRKG